MLTAFSKAVGASERIKIVSRAFSASHLGKQLDKDVFGAIKAQPLPGIAVGIVKARGDQNENFFRNYGVANHSDDLNKSRAISEKTIFPIGSLSKNFTALGVMQLVQKRKIDLDAPLLDYLPYLNIKAGRNESIPMTVRHLLTHTSGIREYRNYMDVVKALIPFGKSGSSLKEYYSPNSVIWTIGEPGRQYVKSHHNFGLAALVLEEVTGQPLGEYCQANIFNPLGMAKTDLKLREDMRADLSDSFALRRQGFKVVKSADTAVVGAGGGYSTAEDLARYLQAFLSPEKAGKGAVTKDIVDAMLTPQYRTNEFLPSQALSFNTQSVKFTPLGSEGKSFTEDLAYLTSGQGMNWSGHQNAFVFSRKLGTASIMLGNSGTHNYAASEISNKALRAALPEWKLGTPKSELAANASGLFPGHAFDGNQAQQTSKVPASLGLPSSAGMPSPQLWPKLVGFYQVPRNQALSARLMWLLGGELQVYQLNGKLMVRSLIGPLRSNLIRRGPGLSLKPADPNNPLNFTVVAPKLALATPARGTTDISFDPATGTLRIGLVTLESRPWYLSYRYPAMAGIIWFFYNLIGKGRAVDITTQLLILGF